jgi:hypothetical protein
LVEIGGLREAGWSKRLALETLPRAMELRKSIRDQAIRRDSNFREHFAARVVVISDLATIDQDLMNMFELRIWQLVRQFQGDEYYQKRLESWHFGHGSQ